MVEHRPVFFATAQAEARPSRSSARLNELAGVLLDECGGKILRQKSGEHYVAIRLKGDHDIRLESSNGHITYSAFNGDALAVDNPGKLREAVRQDLQKMFPGEPLKFHTTGCGYEL